MAAFSNKSVECREKHLFRRIASHIRDRDKLGITLNVYAIIRKYMFYSHRLSIKDI